MTARPGHKRWYITQENNRVSPKYIFSNTPNPYGSKDPNSRALGPNFHAYYSIRALEPYHLGPWTLREFKIFSKLPSLQI